MERPKISRFKPIFSFAVVVLLVACAFAYGQHVRRMRVAITLRQAHLVASGYYLGHGPIAFTQEDASGPLSALPAAAADPSTHAGLQMSQNSGPSGESQEDIDDLLESDSPMATFQQVYLLLKDQYVEKIPSDLPLGRGAAAAMLDSLDDANSRFLDPDEHAALEAQAKDVFAGTGLVITIRRSAVNGLADRQVIVIDALPGSPADKAGLKTGDVITTVNGHWIIGYDPFAAQAKVLKKLSNDEYDWNKVVDSIEKKVTDGISLSKAQTLLDTSQTAPLALVVDREGTPKPISITMNCSAPTTVKDLDWKKLDNGKGYVRINTFGASTAADFSLALTSLAGTNGLVLDLRDCPGGLLDPAIAIARSLSPGATFGMVTIRDNHAPKTAGLGANSAQASKASDEDSGSDSDTPKRQDFGTRTEVLRGDDAAVAAAYTGTIVVLVNKGTANSAELLAAFLHDRRGCRIVGTTTFGDAMAQTLFPLSDGSAFTLTTGVLKTDIGKPFNISGLAPDVALRDAGTAGEPDDPGLDRAEALLSLGPLTAAQARPSPGTPLGKL